MIKDNRKTKENSKNQEQYINWIKEYFAEAPVTITNDKTKLYITHNNYPVSIENTSIIEQFTNKNKGIEFTKEQAIKEAEILRNELAVEVKNYKAVGIDLMQSLIKQYFNQFFAYKDCNRDYKLVFDNEYPYEFKIHYYHKTYDFDFENIISEFIADKRLVDMSFTDVAEFSKSITVDKIYNSGDYGGLVYSLVDSVVSYNFDNDITLTENNYEIFFSLDGEDIFCSDYHGLYVEILRDMKENAYDNFIEIVDYVLEEIGYYLSSISDEYEEQEECAKFAEENYEKDIKQLIEKLEADIKIKYPNFKINNKSIYASDFDNRDFICNVTLDDYYFELDSYCYDVFEQNEFMPHVNKFDYDSFLYVVEKELNIIKKEILEDLSE